MQSLVRAAAILRLFTPAEPELSLGTVAKRLRFPRSTTHRLLTSLVQVGMLAPGSRPGWYQLGYEVIRLGNIVQSEIRPGNDVYRLMRALSIALDETLALSVLDDDEILVIERVETAQTLRVVHGIGARLPAYCTASGRILLSSLPPAELEAYLDRVRTPSQQPLTPAERAKVRHAVELAQKHGHAVDDEDYCPGVIGLAVPVSTGSHGCVAALTLSGPTTRMRALVNEQTVAMLRETARAIGRSRSFLRALSRLEARTQTRD